MKTSSEMVAYYRVKTRKKMLRDNRAKAKARRDSADSRAVTGDIPGEPVSSRSSSKVPTWGTTVVMEFGATGGKDFPVTVGSKLVTD